MFDSDSCDLHPSLEPVRREMVGFEAICRVFLAYWAVPPTKGGTIRIF
jgi:hypothetical protein